MHSTNFLHHTRTHLNASELAFTLFFTFACSNNPRTNVFSSYSWLTNITLVLLNTPSAACIVEFESTSQHRPVVNGIDLVLGNGRVRIWGGVYAFEGFMIAGWREGGEMAWVRSGWSRDIYRLGPFRRGDGYTV
jgi:hypothetical protein